MRIRTIMLAALMAGSAASPLLAADGIRSVTLSSGGLAQVTRSQHVAGRGEINMTVPFDQVDDVLKSLFVDDPSGTVRSMTLDGMDQAEETFGKLPFTPDDMRSVSGLLGALQGTRVRATSAGRTVAGKVLGVSEQSAGKEGGSDRILSILSDEGAIETLPLGPDANVAILDEAMLRKVSDAAQAAGKSKLNGSRILQIGIEGDGERDISVSYVVAAPIWKTAYRVVSLPDGKARLQAWAVIENATGEDWRQVAVTLSSGAPVTLRQQLYRRYWRDRPEVPVDSGASFVPAPDTGVIRSSKAMAGASADSARFERAPAMALEAPAPAPIAMSAASSTGTAVEGDVSATYALPGPVDLPAGNTLSVPIVDTEVAANRVSVFQPSAESIHPVAALMIVNDTGTSLPPGILTVYDERDGYVGDAQLLGIPGGETRMASFATDRKVDVVSEERPDQTIASVTVVDGTAKVEIRSRDETTYAIKGAADGSRTVVIEHPRRDGWSFTSTALDGSTPTAQRLKVEVPAGAMKEVKAVYEKTDLQSYGLSDADDDLITAWANGAADPQTARKLKDLAAARSEASKAVRDISRIEERAERVRNDQERIRANLQAVPATSELATKYLADMATQERDLAALSSERDAADDKRRRYENEVGDIIRTF